MVISSPDPIGISYPRACHPCANAKVKCVPSVTTGGSCERLKKDCLRSTTESRRQRQRPKTHVSRLEQKLDGIINLLARPREELQSSISASPLPQGPQDNSPGVPPNAPTEQRRMFEASERFPARGPAKIGPGPVNESEVPKEIAFEFSPGFAQANALLNRFRVRMTAQFPFVVIPETTNADSLRQEKPFLFRAIMVAASHDNLVCQRTLGKEAIQYLSTHLIALGEKSLDLLQGILVIMAWYHPHLFVNQQFTNLLHLAAAILVDLGFNRPPNSMLQLRLVSTGATPAEMSRPKSRTSDERRALLGCFYLKSVISKSLKNTDPLRYNPHMEECCKFLSETGEYETDPFLVNLVRLQRIVEGIGQNMSHQDIVNEWWTASTVTPVGLYVQSFRNDIQKLRKTFMLMHCYAAETYLYECAISSYKNSASPGLSSHPLPMLDMLHACLMSIRNYLDGYFSIEEATYFDVPLTIWAIVSLILISLSRLYALEAENWDPAQIRQVVDPSKTVADMITRFAEAKISAGISANDLFVFFARRLRAVKAWYDSTTAGLGRQGPQFPFTVHLDLSTGIEEAMRFPQAGEKTTAEAFFNPPTLFDSWDESFWQYFICDWDGTLEKMQV